MVTVTKAAKELGLMPRRVRYLIENGTLKAEVASPRLYLIERKELDRLKKVRAT